MFIAETLVEDGTRFALTDEELQASYRLRYKVYVESMGRLREKGDHDRKELCDEYDQYARAVISIRDGEPVGTLRVFWGGDAPFVDTLIKAYHVEPFKQYLSEDQICIVERMMIDEQHRGSSVALHLYKEVMYFVLENEVEVVLLDCEPHHLNSYLRLGFRPFTYPYSYPGIGLVIPMVLIVGDYDHLKRLRSPFAILARPEDLSYCKYVPQLQSLVEDQSQFLEHYGESKAGFLESIYAFRTEKEPAFDIRPTVFDSLTDEEIERLVKKSNIIVCQKGNHIIEKDNAAKTLFIILSGFAEVRRDDELIAMVSPGEIIGELAFFLGIPRTASIIAVSDELKILSFDEHSLSKLLMQEGELANKVLMNISRSLCTRIVNSV
jgi:predicted GNAT family N-acyltransferase